MTLPDGAFDAGVMRARTDDTRPYVLAAMMLAVIHDGDMVSAKNIWRSIDPDTQYKVLVAVACQVERGDLTLASMMGRVNDVVGAR